MKELKDFAGDINKCSKCGLCQSVCPIYKITGNDCAVSKGKFVMLEGVLKGDLKLSKNIEKYLDMCLKCGKCKDFCPSGIDVCKIFNIAKHMCAKNTFQGKVEKFLESKQVFGNFLKLSEKISGIFRTSGVTYYQTKTSKTKLLYFKGCVNKIFPKIENDLKKVFKNLDAILIEKNFDCCGLPFLSGGNYERFEEVKKHNLELINGDFNYILTDCASCESTLKSYFSKAPEKTDCKKPPEFINAAEFVSLQNIKFNYKTPANVTFHKPCHLENADFVPELLKKCENINYIEMKNFDECCGFVGEFAIKNPSLSIELAKNKAKNIIETGADIVLTTCPSCVLGIIEGYLALGCLHKHPPKVMNIMEFLAKADEITKDN